MPVDRRDTVYVKQACLLKPDHPQARLRRLAAAMVVAAPQERVSLEWNSSCGLFCAIGRPDFRWEGLGRGVRAAPAHNGGAVRVFPGHLEKIRRCYNSPFRSRARTG
jgi:hypothetical protein